MVNIPKYIFVDSGYNKLTTKYNIHNSQRGPTAHYGPRAPNRLNSKSRLHVGDITFVSEAFVKKGRLRSIG